MDFGIFQAVDFLKFFFLHAFDFHFVHLLFVSLTLKFFFDLLPDPVSLFLLVNLTLSSGFRLLRLNHLFDLLSFGFFNISVLLKLLLQGLFLKLSLIGLPSSVVDWFQLFNLCPLVLLLWLLVVSLGLGLLFSFLLLFPCHLYKFFFNVTTSLGQDFLGTLPSFIDLLEKLKTKCFILKNLTNLAFLVLKQANAVA